MSLFNKKLVLNRVWRQNTSKRGKVDEVGCTYLTDDESKDIDYLTKEAEGLIKMYFAQDGYYSCEKEGGCIVVYDSCGNLEDSSEYPHRLRVGDYTLVTEIINEEEEEEYEND